MGKLLDSLVHRHRPVLHPGPQPVCGDQPEAIVSLPLPDSAPGPAMADQEDVEEFPFIEVGAPDKKIDASPTVLAAPPTPINQAKKPSPQKMELFPSLVPNLRDSAPLAVTLENWPRDGQRSGITRDIITFHQPDHPVSQQYGELYERMVADLTPGSTRLLAGVGVAPQSGATTVLLNLAFHGAGLSTHRLVLVEVNSQRPALAQRLGLAPGPGLGDVLAGSCALEKAILTTPSPALKVMSCGKKSPISSQALQWLFLWLRERFEVILVDAPDLTDTAALSPLVPLCDAVYLILPRDGDTPAQTNARAQTVIRLGGPLRGLIHTHYENTEK